MDGAHQESTGKNNSRKQDFPYLRDNPFEFGFHFDESPLSLCCYMNEGCSWIPKRKPCQ